MSYPREDSWSELKAGARVAEGGLDLRPRRRAKVGALANSAKLRAGEASFRACDRALQTFGAFGYAKEFHDERRRVQRVVAGQLEVRSRPRRPTVSTFTGSSGL